MADTGDADSPAWVHAHSHEPNLVAPGGDGSLLLQLPEGSERQLTVTDLAALPSCARSGRLPDCQHGARHLRPICLWWRRPRQPAGRPAADRGGLASSQRLERRRFRHPAHPRRPGCCQRRTADPAGLSLRRQTAPPRARGLVRLVVPAEVDDALRQVKWVSHIRLSRSSD